MAGKSSACAIYTGMRPSIIYTAELYRIEKNQLRGDAQGGLVSLASEVRILTALCVRLNSLCVGRGYVHDGTHAVGSNMRQVRWTRGRHALRALCAE